MVSPSARNTEVRTAAEFNVYFQKIMTMNQGGFEETNTEEAFLPSPTLNEESQPEPAKLYSIASQSFDAISKVSVKSNGSGSNTDLAKTGSVTNLKNSNDNFKVAKGSMSGSQTNLYYSAHSINNLKAGEPAATVSVAPTTKPTVTIKPSALVNNGSKPHGLANEVDASIESNAQSSAGYSFISVSEDANIEYVMAAGAMNIPSSIAENAAASSSPVNAGTAKGRR